MFGGEFPPPRPFQERTFHDLHEGALQGHRRQCVMAPTGGGKTYIGAKLMERVQAKGRRGLFGCDRLILVNQTSETFERYGLWSHGIIQANNPRLDLSRPLQIASLQTLKSRGWPAGLDLIIVDECHTMHKTWVDYVTSDDFKGRVIGLSATPFSKGLGKIFTNLVNAATMHELTELGVLVPMRIFSCRKPDMAGAETRGGEWTEKAAEERELVIIGDVVTEWTRHANGLKTIIFGATILHCEELCKQFIACGIQAAVFTANTTDEERKKLLAEYRRHDTELRILISVEALAKGFDVPDVQCICDCRPLRKSLSTAIQMWGRGLRSSPETGKTECLLLDFSGNIIRFAYDFSQIYFYGLDTLDDGEKLDKKVRKDEEHEARACPKCGYAPMGKKCIGCGYEPVNISLLQVLPGKMKEVILGGKQLAPTRANLYAQLVTYVKRHSRPENWKLRVAHLFQDLTGTWPPNGYSVATAPVVEPTPETKNRIRYLDITFARRRAS